MTMPTVICIGAGRSGSTSLHACLGQHPDIFAASKELNFFLRDPATGCLPDWASSALDARASKDLYAYQAAFEDGADYRHGWIRRLATSWYLRWHDGSWARSRTPGSS